MSLYPKTRRNLGVWVSLPARIKVRPGCFLSHRFLYFSLFLIFVFPQISLGAALKSRSLGESTSGSYYSDYDYGAIDTVPGTEGMSEMEVISTLRHDIQVLDEELATCERKRKGWVAATVVGGVGVVGTGIAALVQNSKIQDKKSELKRVQGDISDTKAEIDEANKKLESM